MIAAQGLFPNTLQCRRPQQGQPKFLFEVRLEGRRNSHRTIRRVLRQLPRTWHRLPIEQFKKPIQRGTIGFIRFSRSHPPIITERRNQPFHFRPIIRSLLGNQNSAAIGHQRAKPIAHAIRTTEHLIAGISIHACHPRRHTDATRHAVELRHRKALLRHHQIRADHPRRMTSHAFGALQSDQPFRLATIQPIRNPGRQGSRRAPSINFIAGFLETRE